MKFLPVLAAVLAGMVLLSASGVEEGAGAAQPVVGLKVSQVAFSPNGDGRKDKLRATIRVVQPVTLTIEIVREQSGSVVFSDAPGVSVQPGVVSFRWNGRVGRAASGKLARDGRYILRVTATDASGSEVVAEQQILLDTHPPVALWGRGGVRPTVLRKGVLTLRFRVYDLDQAQLKVVLHDQAGDGLGTGRAAVVTPGRVALRWPRAHDARLVPGMYSLELKAVDEAGNSSLSKARRFLVDHPVRSHVDALFRGVGRRVALTFDDCNSGTAWSSILNTLRRYKVKAMFFCPGQQVLANRSLARRTVREGHAIGSHGWDHADFSRLSFSSAEKRLVYDRQVWWKLARVSPTPYFRPPYGAYNATAIAAAGREGYGSVVLWDVDPQDWRLPGSAAIAARVLTHARPGSIILMHVLDQTAAALPSIIRGLRARHLAAVSLPELDRIGRATSDGWPLYGSARSGA